MSESGPSFDLHRLRTISQIQQVTHFAELPSTNSYALEVARQHGLPETPWLILTDRQTQGRGRGRNQWWADAGSLTFSFVLTSDNAILPAEHWPQVSLVTGLAVCETLLHFSPRLDIQLKWPNDVLVDQKKLGGILVERVVGSPDVLVIGVGLNINNSQRDAPTELKEQLTSFGNATDDVWDLNEVLIKFLHGFFHECSRWQTQPGHAWSRWNQLCFLSGKFITIQQHDSLVQGFCEGFDLDGALLIRSENGLQKVISGTVVEFE